MSFSFLLRLRAFLEAPHGIELAPTHVRRLERADDRLSGEVTLIERLADGDFILCVPGDVVPCHGMIVDGCAAVRENASDALPNDGVHAVLRAGSPVRPGIVVLSNFLIVRVGEESLEERLTWLTSRSARGRSRRRSVADGYRTPGGISCCCRPSMERLPSPNWAPDLRHDETRLLFALLVKF